MNVLERKFKKKVIEELHDIYPGAVLIGLDPEEIQGIPDLLFLYGPFWGTFETKRNLFSPVRPNQAFWVDKMNRMSYSSFLFPENKNDVFQDLDKTLLGRGIL